MPCYLHGTRALSHDPSSETRLECLGREVCWCRRWRDERGGAKQGGVELQCGYGVGNNKGPSFDTSAKAISNSTATRTARPSRPCTQSALDGAEQPESNTSTAAAQSNGRLTPSARPLYYMPRVHGALARCSGPLLVRRKWCARNITVLCVDHCRQRHAAAKCSVRRGSCCARQLSQE